VAASYAQQLAAWQDRMRASIAALAPVGWWRFGEPPGSTGVGAIIDASGNGHNGQALNGVTMGTTGLTAGDADTAFTFGGTSYVSVPLSSALNPAAFTVVGLFTPSTIAAANYTHVASKGTANNTGYLILQNTASLRFYCYKAAGASVNIQSPALTAGTTYLYEAVFDGTNLSLFINGALVAGPTALGAAFVPNTTGPIYIGADVAGVSPFPGVIDEPFILNYAMTPAQIAAFYATWIQGAPAAPNNSGQGTGLIPELSWSAQRLDMTWEKIGSGLSRGINPAGSQFTHAFEGSIGGPASASFVLDDKLRRGRPDLEHFTPVVAHSGAVPVFSGRVIRTPEVRGESYQRHVEVQGWKEHLKDDWWDKTCLVTDLSKWQDARSYASAVLTSFTQKGQVQNDGTIMLSWRNGTPMVIGDWVGVVFDAGPNNLITDWSFDYLSSNNWVNGYLYAMGWNVPTIGDASGVYSSIGATDIQNSVGASGTFTGRFAAGQRYIVLLVSNQIASTIGADVYFKITGARVSTSATYLTSGASTLYTSTIIGAALTAKCPLISTDQSGIATTAFAIPEFYTDWMQPFSIIDKANAYHGWQCLVSSDPVARVSYRAIPTTPTYAVGVVDEYEFDNPSTYDGSEVYSQVIGKYTDAAGVASSVVGVNPTNGPYIASTGVFTNPTAAADTTGWSAVGAGAITRDTVTYDTGPASFYISGTLAGDGAKSSAITGLSVGRAYRLSFWIWPFSVGYLRAYIKNSAGIVLAQQDVTSGAGTYSLAWSATETAGNYLEVGFYSRTDPTVSHINIDSILLTEMSASVVNKRGFTKTKLVDFSSKMTAAAATQVCQIILDASQFPPLKGTLKVRGHIRRYGTGAHIHVSQLKLGEAILLEDETDPNTGAIGRIGIIMQFTYDHESQTATIAIDSNKNFVENLLARLGAVA